MFARKWKPNDTFGVFKFVLISFLSGRLRLKHKQCIMVLCGTPQMTTRYKITVNYIKAVWLNRKWCFISNKQPYRALMIENRPSECEAGVFVDEITVYFEWTDFIQFSIDCWFFDNGLLKLHDSYRTEMLAFESM